MPDATGQSPRRSEPRSSTVGGYDKTEIAGCDDCEWIGESRRAAAAHHRATGHNCHVQRRETFYYGDPMASFLRNNGMVDRSGDGR